MRRQLRWGLFIGSFMRLYNNPKNAATWRAPMVSTEMSIKVITYYQGSVLWLLFLTITTTRKKVATVLNGYVLIIFIAHKLTFLSKSPICWLFFSKFAYKITILTRTLPTSDKKISPFCDFVPLINLNIFMYLVPP
jgi:hypothetical protein